MLPVRPLNWKTNLCRHFTSRGSCTMGENCNFAHGPHELRTLGSGTQPPDAGQIANAVPRVIAPKLDTTKAQFYSWEGPQPGDAGDPEKQEKLYRDMYVQAQELSEEAMAQELLEVMAQVEAEAGRAP